MKFPRTTLEQWRVLQAIVEMGGFAQAAKALNRSQSAISYSVNSLQEQLGTKLLEIQGRKAVLTTQGQALLRRATDVLQSIEDVETFSQELKQGLESEIWIHVDSYLPTEILTESLREFRLGNASTKLQIREALSCRMHESPERREADLVIGPRVTEAGLGDALLSVALTCVAGAGHPLLSKPAPLRRADLAAHTLIMVCEDGTLNPADKGWMGSRSRWVVASLQQMTDLLRANMGYAWLPQHLAQPCVDRGELRYLQLQTGEARMVPMFVTIPHPGTAGPAVWRLNEIFKAQCAKWRSPARSPGP